jgi:hypothetical protein
LTLYLLFHPPNCFQLLVGVSASLLMAAVVQTLVLLLGRWGQLKNLVTYLCPERVKLKCMRFSRDPQGIGLQR